MTNKEKLAKIEANLNNPNIAENLKPAMRSAIEKLKAEIAKEDKTEGKPQENGTYPKNLSQLKKFLKENINHKIFVQRFFKKDDKWIPQFELDPRGIRIVNTDSFATEIPGKPDQKDYAWMQFGKSENWSFTGEGFTFEDGFVKLTYLYKEPTKEKNIKGDLPKSKFEIGDRVIMLGEIYEVKDKSYTNNVDNELTWVYYLPEYSSILVSEKNLKKAEEQQVIKPKFQIGDYVSYEVGDMPVTKAEGKITEVKDFGEKIAYRIDAYFKDDQGIRIFDSAKNNEVYEITLKPSSEAKFLAAKQMFESKNNKPSKKHTLQKVYSQIDKIKTSLRKKSGKGNDNLDFILDCLDQSDATFVFLIKNKNYLAILLGEYTRLNNINLDDIDISENSIKELQQEFLPDEKMNFLSSDSQKFFNLFVGKSQYLATRENKELYQTIIDLYNQIFETPIVYGSNKDSKFMLHYFNSGSDVYIKELDFGTGLQDYGFVILNGDLEMAEQGYVSIQDLIKQGFELDYYYTPQTLAEIKKEAAPENEDNEKIKYAKSLSKGDTIFYKDNWNKIVEDVVYHIDKNSNNPLKIVAIQERDEDDRSYIQYINVENLEIDYKQPIKQNTPKKTEKIVNEKLLGNITVGDILKNIENTPTSDKIKYVKSLKTGDVIWTSNLNKEISEESVFKIYPDSENTLTMVKAAYDGVVEFINVEKLYVPEFKTPSSDFSYSRKTPIDALKQGHKAEKPFYLENLFISAKEIENGKGEEHLERIVERIKKENADLIYGKLTGKEPKEIKELLTKQGFTVKNNNEFHLELKPSEFKTPKEVIEIIEDTKLSDAKLDKIVNYYIAQVLNEFGVAETEISDIEEEIEGNVLTIDIKIWKNEKVTTLRFQHQIDMRFTSQYQVVVKNSWDNHFVNLIPADQVENFLKKHLDELDSRSRNEIYPFAEFLKEHSESLVGEKVASKTINKISPEKKEKLKTEYKKHVSEGKRSSKAEAKKPSKKGLKLTQRLKMQGVTQAMIDKVNETGETVMVKAVKRSASGSEHDKAIKGALRPGKRLSADGNIYYEYRDNMSDVTNKGL